MIYPCKTNLTRIMLVLVNGKSRLITTWCSNFLSLYYQILNKERILLSKKKKKEKGFFVLYHSEPSYDDLTDSISLVPV